MLLQTLFSAQQCFEQLLMVTLAKLDKLEVILKQQQLSESDACVASSLISNLRQYFSASQVWLVDKTVTVSPLKLAQEQLEALNERLRAARLPMGSHGVVGMLVRSLNTYTNLLNSQAQQLRHQHLRQLHKPLRMSRMAVH
jgi:hypothetical protein